MLPYPKSLFDAYSYDPTTGEFRHKRKRGAVEGKLCGCCNGNGYIRIIHKKKTYYAHRLAWFFMVGEVPPEQIDHINGDTKDNRISNLRLATPKQNAWNKTKATGVSWHEKSGKWQAFCHRTYLGLFDNAEDAVMAYKKAKQEINPFGDKND